MAQFAQVLGAMHGFLLAVGEASWAEWVARDLEEWRRSRDVDHHLSAYGGMGSFTDLVICGANGHQVTPSQEPWANALLHQLQSLGFRLATNRGRDLPISALFSLNSPPTTLDGWRCLACGHAETTVGDLESLLAGRHLPRSLSRRLHEGSLQESVAEVLSLKVAEADPDRERLRRLCATSGLFIVERSGWMRPCPACGSDNTSVYRWLTNGGLTPSPDNLPLRNGAG